MNTICTSGKIKIIISDIPTTSKDQKMSKLFNCSTENRNCFQNSKTILCWIFSLLGFDILHYNKTTFRNKIVCFCQKLSFLCIIAHIVLLTSKLLTLNHITTHTTKAIISNFILVCISASLWCTLYFSNEKISNVMKDLTKISLICKVKTSYTFTVSCFAVTAAAYFISVVYKLYPFTDEEYSRVLSSVYFLDLENESLVKVLAIFLTVWRQAYVIFMPNCLVTMYVITCNYMKNILHFYVQKKISGKENSTDCLNFYSYIQNIFQSFESTFSLPIFIAFSSNLANLLLSILIFKRGEENIPSVCMAVINTVALSLTMLSASSVHEADKTAKEENLDCLETMIKPCRCIQFKEIMKLWRTNNSQAFSLSAWGFFSFTKGLYLTSMGCMVTYILLLVNME